MHKSILVLEESRMVHELFESALPDDYMNWEVNHESLPDRYLQKANETNPDIIFLSNQDQKRDYATVRQLKSSPIFSHTPILLLTSAKDRLDENLLQSIGVRGFVRKPFETTTLQKQINIVLKEQEKDKSHKSPDRLKDLNVVDDDLMDLLSGQSAPGVSLDQLEGELDPTLQLIPEDQADDEEEVETELLPMDDTDELQQAEFIEDEVEFDDSLEEDNDDDLELQGSNVFSLEEDDDDDLGLEVDDIELEELDDESDFMDLDDDQSVAIDLEPAVQSVRTIPVVQGASSSKAVLKNDCEDKNDLGFMELHVIPLRGEKIKSHVVETISDDFDEEDFVKKHSPAELENEFMPVDPEMEMESLQNDDSDEIVIPHEEIIEDFYEGEELEDDLEDDGLLELSIEGMEDELSDSITDEDSEEVVAFEELDDSDDTIEEINIGEMNFPGETDDVLMVSQEDEVDDIEDISTLEQDESIDVEIDLQSDPMSDMEDDEHSRHLFDEFDDDDELDEDNLSESELEKRRSDQLDIDLEEIAAAGSEEASATIQEMIGFRQVMKAKYELPDSDLGLDSEELEEDFDNEIGEDEDLLADVEGVIEDDEEGELLVEDDPFLDESADDMDLPEDQDDLFMDIPAEAESESEKMDLLVGGDESESDDMDLLVGDDEPEDMDLLAVEDEDESEDLGLLAAEDEDESEDLDLLAVQDEDEPEDMDLLAVEDEDDFGTEDLADDLELPSDEEPVQEDDELDDIDLLADFDDEPPANASEQDNVFDDAELLSDEEPGQDADDLFEDPDDITDDFQMDEAEDDIFSIQEDDDDVLIAPMEMNAMEESNLLSDEEDVSEEPEESFEEIELLTNDEQEDESESLLQVDEDMDDDVDALIIDEDEMDNELSLDAPDDLPLIGEDFSTDAGELADIASESMEDIDFLPIDEDSDEDDIDLAVEIDDDQDEDDDFSDSLSDDSVDDIDFLPVDEQEAEFGEEETEEATASAMTDMSLDDEIDSGDDIDFLPGDTDQADEMEEDFMDGEIAEIDDADDLTIEVPQETFEMSDFNINEITDLDGEVEEEDADEVEITDQDKDLDLMDGIETVSMGDEPEALEEDETEEDTTDSYQNIDLPTMDEDLPDLHPIMGLDDESEEEVEEIESLPTIETDESDIMLMQQENDFDEFDSEQEIIGLVEEPKASTGIVSESDQEEIKKQAQRAAASLTPEFRKKLSEMIEGVVSETVHNTLQERLPGLVDKLMHEEMGD